MCAPSENLLMVCEPNPSQAGLGRFLSRDVFRSANRYEYCASNPVSWLDPHGLQLTDGPGSGLTWESMRATWEGVRPYIQSGLGLFLGDSPQRWRDAEGIFSKWMAGTMPQRSYYGPETPEARDMQNSRLVNYARIDYGKLLFRNKDCPDEAKLINQGMNFSGWDALLNLTLQNNATRSRVGSFHVDIVPIDPETVKISIRNSTTTESYNRHYEHLGGKKTPQIVEYGHPMSNVYETIEWTEPTPPMINPMYGHGRETMWSPGITRPAKFL